MSKTKKRNITIGVLFALLLTGLIVAILIITFSSSATVNVYQVGDLSMESSKQTSVTMGKVTNAMSQSVRLTGEERVAEVYVKKGDRISSGDKLFTYDTRSLQIELENKKLAVETANVNIYKANLELEKLKTAKPTEKSISGDASENSAKTGNKLNTEVNGNMTPYKGNGTKNNPYTYLVASGAAVSANYMKARSIERPENRYEILEYREDDKFKGLLIYSVSFVFKKDGSYDVNLSQTENGFNITPGVAENYTQSQLTYAITNKQIEISGYELDKSIAENEYASTVNKIKNSTVYATVSGTVITLLDYKEAKTTGDPYIEIIGRRGFFVQGFVSELQLADIKVGSKVNIKNIADNVNCKGTIAELSDYPAANADEGDTTGNTNVSYYPYTVEVSANENLKIGDEVEINLNKDADNTYYILKSFVNTDSDGYYVFKSDEKGLLKKQYIEAGNTLYGEYLEIKSGITETDLLAFPYEKGIKEGVKTKQATQQELFGDMY